jgi:nicotinate-nucleotide pyrophosphorylase
MDEIAALASHDVDILDVGRAIIDAPMVDIKLDVVAEELA